jgi:glutathione S-transferase
VVARLRARTFLLPEDAALLRVRPVAAEANIVQRCAWVWRNDVENLPLFLALALAFVLAGAPASSAALFFTLYVALRYLHTLAYLLGLQPWRAILFLGSLATCWAIAIKTALLTFAA